MQNAGFFRMMTRSQDPYPELPPGSLRRLRIPVLVITGEKTVEIHRRIDEELAKAIPRARSASIPNAGHGSPRENPRGIHRSGREFSGDQRKMKLRTGRREFLQGAASTASLLALRTVDAGNSTADAWQRAADIVRNVKPPAFPDRLFDITKHGALPDGVTLNTKAIAKAIEACANAGGGRVLVPAGRFLTGAIHLKSNVELHVSEGATLLFDINPASYPIVFTRWEGMECMNYSPLIYARKQKNIAITGKGTLDGQGSEQNWWPWKGRWGGTVAYGWKEGMPDQTSGSEEGSLT